MVDSEAQGSDAKLLAALNLTTRYVRQVTKHNAFHDQMQQLVHNKTLNEITANLKATRVII